MATAAAARMASLVGSRGRGSRALGWRHPWQGSWPLVQDCRRPRRLLAARRCHRRRPAVRPLAAATGRQWRWLRRELALFLLRSRCPCSSSTARSRRWCYFQRCDRCWALVSLRSGHTAGNIRWPSHCPCVFTLGMLGPYSSCGIRGGGRLSSFLHGWFISERSRGINTFDATITTRAPLVWWCGECCSSGMMIRNKTR